MGGGGGRGQWSVDVGGWGLENGWWWMGGGCWVIWGWVGGGGSVVGGVVVGGDPESKTYYLRLRLEYIAKRLIIRV